MGYVLAVLQIAVLVTTVYAFVHAALQRPDAYTAADKLTKPAWLGITGASLAMLVLFEGPRSSGLMFWIAALVAVLVYIVDVRPALQTVQGGGQRW